jgi:hypothetical protein
MIKFLTALAVAIAAAIRIWMKYYSKSARIERLEKKAEEYEVLFKKAIADTDVFAYTKYRDKWQRVSDAIGHLRG